MFFDDCNLALLKPKYKLDRSAAIPMQYVKRDIDLYSDNELIAASGDVLAYDVEVYPNYFCVSFKHIKSGKVAVFEYSPDNNFSIQKLKWVMENFTLVGFNNKKFDRVILWAALEGYAPRVLHEITVKLIVDDVYYTDIVEQYGLFQLGTNEIDLIEVAPLKASLKMYAARLHCKRMQDLPFEPNKFLERDEAEIIKLYNINDLDNTILLYKELLPQIKLREQLSNEYGQDLRSLSDAQIAEHVICSELKKVLGYYPKRPNIAPGSTFKYQIPEFISFQTPVLQEILEIVRNTNFYLSDVDEDGDGGGKIMMPPELADRDICIGSSVYRMGIGGLHSSESCVTHRGDANTLLIDRDVASFYPNIILLLRLFPKHLGEAFLVIYDSLVQKRLTAKNEADKLKAQTKIDQMVVAVRQIFNECVVISESGKIIINGSFGKLGNKYSRLFSPDLMIQVTITGQLSLLMLIEAMELQGIPVVSGNTDGVVMKCPAHKYDELNAVVRNWEMKTRFKTEETQYSAVYSRDVNNYIAIKTNGDVKTKGVFSEKGSALNSRLSKNPESLICSDALVAFLKDGTPIDKTIFDCNKIERFVTVRNVKGGAHKDGVYLGKAVRFYYAVGESGTINYISSGNTVPNSDGAKPLMDLPDQFPTDVDYGRYVRETENMLQSVGYYGTKELLSRPKLF